MVIIYGHRAYGRVDEWGGEYAQTSFVHIYYMPIVPTGSLWVTREHAGTQFGVPIEVHLKSVAATYLRTWAIVAAVVAFSVAPGLVTGSVALALGLASAYSWTWLALRGAAARHRSDFNLLAFGTRCEPKRMPRDTRAKLAASLEERRSKLAEQRPVEDVARFGAHSLDEAVLAYGVLRIAALDHRDAAADAAADRLLAGSHDKLPSGDGPYRDAQTVSAGALQAEVAEVAARHTAQVAGGRAGEFLRLPAIKVIVVVGLALFALVMISSNSGALFGIDEVTRSQLESAPPYFKLVTVTCDGIDGRGQLVDPNTDRVTESVFFCRLGDKKLVVLADPTAIFLANPIEGRVKRPPHSEQWKWPPELTDEPGIMTAFLDATGHHDLALAIAGLVAAGVALALGSFWLRRYLRARQRR